MTINYSTFLQIFKDALKNESDVNHYMLTIVLSKTDFFTRIISKNNIYTIQKQVV